ncbi:AraC-type DNA-binding protein [Paenibacillus sp. UNCCL117]|uniref:AraC family transcriptional regulator n=1 Tax=unclassified Paenibacillus TaxID=185978 RepID=UPI00088E92C9|nr:MULTISPECIES: AraC family transcriptional regulator [unclassified Paenibacillus]SDC64804.1 AraC-type DNA-binding protein [Paenibacillus sp. cl123]SFW22608.1 AraC-type DNA-binding protein [Paenibacillus sp. UNCCL117]
MKLDDYDVVPYIRNADYAIRPPFFLGERSLLDYLIFYVQEGTFEIRLAGRTHILKQGDLCLLQPGDQHTIRGLDDTINPYVHLDFFYQPARGQSFITLPGQVDMEPYAHLMQPRLNDFAEFELPLKLNVSQPQRMRDLLMKMIEAWRLQTYIGKMSAQKLAHEWFLAMASDFMKSPQQPPTHAKPLLNWITSYFAFHISEPIKVEDMAKRAGLSPSRFNVVFKEAFGVTPYQYLLSLRVEHAKELLGNGYPIKVASEYCGFTSVHYFSKAFKGAVGLTPGQYKAARQHGGER